MSTATTRWNLVVSKKIDQSLREFLAQQGRGRKGDLSRFVEEAVNRHIFDTALRAVHEANANVDPEEIDAAIEESLAWARARMR
jgi:3-hydroxyacyl-CoA dehydrogenase